jgi:23S rRNA maturation mini-RNase III
MPETIQVRNVPKKVHAELTRQAKNAGMSLNAYLLGEFDRITKRGRNSEFFRKMHAMPGKRPTREEIVATIREIRDSPDSGRS